MKMMRTRRKPRSLMLQSAVETARGSDGETGWFVLGRAKSAHVPLASSRMSSDRERTSDWFAPRKPA